MRAVLPLAALATCVAGCATPLAWEPRVERLPEAQTTPAPAPAAQAARPLPVTFDEIAKMAREGTPSGVIIQKLCDSRLVYSLSADQAKDLAARGVPADVIAYLERGEAGIAPQPVYVPAPAHPNPYPAYGYPYYAYPRPYPYYPRSSIYFGFGRRW